MFRNWSITWRLSVSMLLIATLVLAAVIGYGYLVARQILEQELEAKAWQMSRAAIGKIQTVEAAVRKLTDGVDAGIEVQAPASPERTFRLLERLVMDNEEVFGAAIALEPGAMGLSQTYFAPFVYRGTSSTVRGDRALQATPYTVQDWYTLPKMLSRPIWSEPYRSESAKDALMVIYSVPLNLDDGTFLGVVRCDISLTWMSELLRSLDTGAGGYAFILSANGTFISHPNSSLILNESIFSLAETENNPALREVGRKMVRGDSGYVPFNTIRPGKSGWLLYQPMAVTGWSLGIYLSDGELKSKLDDLSRKEGIIGIIGFMLLLPVILFIASTVTGPLRKLAEAAKTLAAGNLSAPLPEIPGQDEAASLARDFSHMRDELKQHIELLAAAATQKERMESELRIARSIQMELVPKTFPPFPNRRDFSLHATMEPAREVGGDFYDFMMPDPDHLWIVIGDVSGKGIPAAMFMAVTRTFLRAFVQEEKSPGTVLRRVNDELARNNDSNMFVTIFCGVLHLPSGRFCWANGGHNLPFRLPACAPAEFLPKTKGTMLGAMAGMAYAEACLDLESGDVLFLYTDGVTEAMDAEANWFGNEQTQAALEGLQGKSCLELVAGMQAALQGFVGEAEQSDDITMLAMQFFGSDRR